ncbi:T-cell surface antigen CD2-like [Carcharodon carcharias]|uniref:T-cell surface antigen CD2-like n=1 Tax=Carcharodon carcharias TaxID=13397 RepID=UPI001B7F5381|nr:T-cell surface antigen CD2-like [Carcharodon carcharias]
MFCYQKCSLQFNIIFLLTTSGPFLTESCDTGENVYGELGKSVFLDVQDQNSHDYHEIKWKKGDKVVARYKNNLSKAYGGNENRLEVSPNGTLTFKIGKKTDEGKYQFEIYNKDGILLSTEGFKLHLLVSVSKPVLNLRCISSKWVNITCKVENGTSFTLKLSGDSLNETGTDRYLNKMQHLEKTGSMQYICVASNKISKTEDSGVIDCSETQIMSFNEIMILAGAAGLVTILIILVVYCIRKCHGQKRGDVVENTPQAELKAPINSREQMKQPRQPIPRPGQHFEEYTAPKLQSRKPEERGERMNRGERAQQGEREHRGERAQRGVKGDRTQRGESAQRGERTQRGDRVPKTEKRELRVDRGPVPLPPRKVIDAN